MKLKKCLLVGGLIISVGINFLLGFKIRNEGQAFYLHFENANEWESSFSIHHIKEAQASGKGKGVKVGILDHYFGTAKHGELYTADVDFLNRGSDHENISEHGYWLTCTLKEVAPECEVYALSTLDSDETKRVEAMEKAIDWAIEHELDILTYSAEYIEQESNRARLDTAVEKAVAHGINIVFIHYENDLNTQPTGIYEEKEIEEKGRTPLTVYDYDYNLLFRSDFMKYAMGNVGADATRTMYYSQSSMSIYVAGFIAILRSIDPDLAPEQYEEILRATTYETEVREPITLEGIKLQHVVNIEQAVDYIKTYEK